MIDFAGVDPEEVWFVNRWLVVVRIRQPYVDWAMAIDDGGPKVVIDLETASPSAFLVPWFEYEEHARHWVEENFNLLFEIVLAGWCSDPDTWPEDRSWPAGSEWFDLELLEAPWDVVPGPISSTASGPFGSTD